MKNNRSPKCLMFTETLDPKEPRVKDGFDILVETAAAKGIELELCRVGEKAAPFDDFFAQFSRPDFALVRTEDLPYVKLLEAQQIPVFNSSQTIEICCSKAMTGSLLAANGIPVPKTVVGPSIRNDYHITDEYLKELEEHLGFPMIVKKDLSRQGTDINLVKNMKELRKCVDSYFPDRLVFQEYLASSKGKDMRVTLVDGKVVSSFIRYNDADFRSNLCQGGTAISVPISEEYEKVAVAAAHAVGGFLVGVDLLFTEDGPKVCEVNGCCPGLMGAMRTDHVNIANVLYDSILEKIGWGEKLPECGVLWDIIEDKN